MNTTARGAIRSDLLATRRSLDVATQRAASAEVSKAVFRLVQKRFGDREGTIATYVSHRGEIDPNRSLAHFRSTGWSPLLPICGKDGHMEFAPWNPGDPLAKNRYGIDEPRTEPVAVTDIDVVLVPGVAFDLLGNRLGHGVGFYDRFFSRCAQQLHDPYRLGLAYDFQVVELPAPEPWDIPVNSVVSPSQVIDTTPCE